jgi:hypothetical protein
VVTVIDFNSFFVNKSYKIPTIMKKRTISRAGRELKRTKRYEETFVDDFEDDITFDDNQNGLESGPEADKSSEESSSGESSTSTQLLEDDPAEGNEMEGNLSNIAKLVFSSENLISNQNYKKIYSSFQISHFQLNLYRIC